MYSQGRTIFRRNIMIKISNDTLNPAEILDQYSHNEAQTEMINKMAASNELFRYRTLEQFKFELTLRDSIINASKKLNSSRFSFRTFRKSKCNPDFWQRTEEGGFLLETGVKPSDAINDIFKNSYLYGTECATAIVIVYFKALVDVFPEEQFNKLFPEIYLMNWQHLDEDLGITGYREVSDLIPGDCRYFSNPDVDPLTPEWQGENTIYLGNEKFYGHGIGVRTADSIIEALNRHRKSGAEVSAFLENFAHRLDFRTLADVYADPTRITRLIASLAAKR
jgi:protein-glutamine gamma-glutamyltransferase